MKTASLAFASPWMPRDIKITASPENGLWVVRAQQKDTDEQLAIMQIDCDNDECIVYYRNDKLGHPADDGAIHIIKYR